jgi:UDP-glucose 4-epimerase
MKKKILITGGLGFIGSHLACSLLNAGYDVVLFDNLSNSKVSILKKIQIVTSKTPVFFKGDLRKQEDIESVLKLGFQTVIHMASLKSVPNSFTQKDFYHTNNVLGSLNLLKSMNDFNIKNIIFSSSATVYGESKYLPIDEKHPLNPSNPYALNKFLIENHIKDYDQKYQLNAVILRYFNPAGAHESGHIGEYISSKTTNLFPQLVRAGMGMVDHLKIFGTDYDTHDGTCIRDFIHIQDLVDAHLQALNFIEANSGTHIFNIGTGAGFSVLNIINTFEKVNNISVNKLFMKRRLGDQPSIYSDPSLAGLQLNWKSKYNLEEMCRHAWIWANNEY